MIWWGQFNKVTGHMNLREGVLYFNDRIVVAKEVKRRVWNQVHAAGHFGQYRTLQMLKRS